MSKLSELKARRQAEAIKAMEKPSTAPAENRPAPVQELLEDLSHARVPPKPLIFEDKSPPIEASPALAMYEATLMPGHLTSNRTYPNRDPAPVIDPDKVIGQRRSRSRASDPDSLPTDDVTTKTMMVLEYADKHKRWHEKTRRTLSASIGLPAPVFIPDDGWYRAIEIVQSTFLTESSPRLRAAVRWLMATGRVLSASRMFELLVTLEVCRVLSMGY